MTKESGVYTAAELYDAILPPMRWIAKDFMAEGITMLSARPKAGKSLLALQLGIAVESGTPFLGRYETVKGPVLYVNVDDPSQKGLQENLHLLGGRAHGLTFMSDLPELDNGGLEILDKELARMATIDPCRLLVLDTLTALRKEQSGKNIVKADYEFIASIRRLERKHGCTVLLISHTRKDSTGKEKVDLIDCHLGTSGLTAAVDAVMLLTGTDDTRKVLKAKGRRISPFEVHLELQAEDRSGWIAVDAPVETAKKKELGALRQRILDEVLAIGPCGPDAVHKQVGGVAATIRSSMKRMLGDGQLWRNQDGLYISSPPQHCNTATDSTSVFNTPDATVQHCNTATVKPAVAVLHPLHPLQAPTAVAPTQPDLAVPAAFSPATKPLAAQELAEKMLSDAAADEERAEAAWQQAIDDLEDPGTYARELATTEPDVIPAVIKPTAAQEPVVPAPAPPVATRPVHTCVRPGEDQAFVDSMLKLERDLDELRRRGAAPKAPASPVIVEEAQGDDDRRNQWLN